MIKGDILDNRYQILEKLGEGGMGVVYKVFDQEREQEVAIKTLLPQTFSDKKSTEQFKREFKLSQQLRRDCITATYDLIQSSEVPFIVMEYVEGEKLTDYIYDQPGNRLEEETFLRLANQILEGIEYAHSKGVVHRDIKSSNIMITKDGKIKIMDFGIAASLRETYSRSTGKSLYFTPEFSSPEFINGDRASVSMDIYSSGCVFYEMLNGEPPFCRGDVIHQQLTKRPEHLDLVSEHFNFVILKCLEKRKEDRFEDIVELRKVLNKNFLIEKELHRKTKKIQQTMIKKERTEKKRIKRANKLVIISSILSYFYIFLFISIKILDGFAGYVFFDFSYDPIVALAEIFYFALLVVTLILVFRINKNPKLPLIVSISYLILVIIWLLKYGEHFYFGEGSREFFLGYKFILVALYFASFLKEKKKIKLFGLA